MDDALEWKLYTDCESSTYIAVDGYDKKSRTKRGLKTCFKRRVCADVVPKRFVFAVFGFLASTLAISLNTNLSLAIVAMVDRANQTLAPSRALNECLAPPADAPSLHEPFAKVGEFQWSPDTEGLALGAVYYGQMLGFLPSGRMAELFGGKKTLLGFFALASLCTVLVPVAARLSLAAFVACRLLTGVGTAPVIPVLFFMISRWVPEQERSFSASFVLAGYGLGAFVSLASAGLLCSSDFLGGWPAVFYLSGICGFTWCIFCGIFVYDTPGDHPTITKKELKYIVDNLGNTEQKQIKNIPWKSIVTSIPFWSLIIGYFGQFWILGFYSTVQALYMGTILNLDSKKNGEMSCIPHLIRGVFACVCGYPADWALRKGYVTKGFIRKTATISNTLLSCCGFVAILAAGCDPTLNSIIFVVGALLGDFVTFGVCMAGVDLAPNLSGTISGILSFAGVIPFFLIPALVGFTTKYERSMYQWRFVYYISIAVVLASTAVYALFGTSEPQSWGIRDDAEEDDVEK